jgi:hypothetical protein
MLGYADLRFAALGMTAEATFQYRHRWAKPLPKTPFFG